MEKDKHTVAFHYRQHRMKSYVNIGTSTLYEPVYEITFTVTNTGKMYGSEVPPKVLPGFERVYLEVGQSKEITLILIQNDISCWNTDNQKWTIASGNYTVFISTSANNDDIKL